MRAVLEISLARAAELPVLADMLPEAFPRVGQPAEVMVARRAGVIVGAAAVSWQAHGFPLLVRVEPRERRQGVGRALLEAVSTDVRGETGDLRAWDLVEEGSVAARFCAACGFEVGRRFCYFSTDAVAFATRMTRLRARAAARIPASAHVERLSDAPSPQLAMMLAEAFAVLPHNAVQRLQRGAPDAYDPDVSLVAMDGERPVGAMLAHAEGRTVEVAVNMVVPAYQGGWANLLLLEHMARACRVAGFTDFVFGCEPHVRDTMNLAIRSDASELPDRLTLVLKL